ncbi:hypothetical protein VTK73DRAFT_7708 [Phialemonium thermophilum]|uniref:Zn(2)-C6 fungal-type domain-containing protein n=1 Tax=Phialemonium thermophilum TaxID=223376 RepID=A0ABR3WDB4_9PEZI
MSGAASAGWRRKACLACTRAKRQCTKATPVCRRCADKGLICQYPFVKQVSAAIEPGPAGRPIELESVHATGGGTPVAWQETPESQLNEVDYLDLSPDTLLVPELGPEVLQQELLKPPSDPNDRWFLSPESFVESHIVLDPNDVGPVDESELRRYTEDVQAWLRQWAAEGHCPLIHRQLYRAGPMPHTIRGAYTALATYYHAKTARNQDVIRRIIDDNAAQLVDDEQQADGSTGTMPPRPRDTMAHLARTQALLAYQVVRFFDGDIRMRAEAEKHIPVLHSWADELLRAAASDLNCEGGHGTTALNMSILTASSDPESISWRLWIVAECVRRTWLTAGILQGVYLTMRQGWAGCPGGLCYTARKGVWDADTAFAWSRACRSRSPLFVPSMCTSHLLTVARPCEVDEFASAMLLTHDPEKLKRWVFEAGGAAERMVGP